MSLPDFSKGEPPGHPFRGNQYTEGGAGGDAPVAPGTPLYHVTLTERVPSIQKLGLLPFGGPTGTSNWLKSEDKERYGEGQIFAFEKEHDAKRWAAKWDWELNKETGSGKVSIVRFKSGHDWQVDTADPLSQSSSRGRWLKSYKRVKPTEIEEATAFTREAARSLVGKYSPDQPRDEHGRWSESGGAGDSGSGASSDTVSGGTFASGGGGEAVLPDKVKEAFTQVAEHQRGAPERAMLDVQFANGGGVLNPVVERAGDLIHRMTNLAKYDDAGYTDIKPIVDKLHRWLGSDYGFEREMEENFAANARHAGVDPKVWKDKVIAALNRYKDEQKKIPVYNRAQFLARAVAIGVGARDFGVAHLNVMTLRDLMPDRETWQKHAFEHQLDENGKPLEYKPWVKKYSPDQPRDEQGRWSEGGGAGGAGEWLASGGVGVAVPESAPLAAALHRQLPIKLVPPGRDPPSSANVTRFPKFEREGFLLQNGEALRVDHGHRPAAQNAVRDLGIDLEGSAEPPLEQVMNEGVGRLIYEAYDGDSFSMSAEFNKPPTTAQVDHLVGTVSQNHVRNLILDNNGRSEVTTGYAHRDVGGGFLNRHDIYRAIGNMFPQLRKSLPQGLEIVGKDMHNYVLAALIAEFPEVDWSRAIGKKEIVIEGVDAHARVLKALAKFAADQPRVAKGEGPGHPFRGNQYTEGLSGDGGGALGFDLSHQNMATIREAVQRGNWELKPGRVRDTWGEKVTSLTISPNDIPANWKSVRSEGTDRVTYYDPTQAHVVNERFGFVAPKTPGAGVPKEEGVLYRGMSYEEYQNAVKLGGFESRGDYNLGDTQKGLTYFSKNPDTAQSYSSGFAPWPYIATPSRPAVVIGIKDPGADKHEGLLDNTGNEIGLRGHIPMSAVQSVYFGKPRIVSTGFVEVVQYANAPPREGSRASPSSSLNWERQDVASSQHISGKAVPIGSTLAERVANFRQGIVYHGTTRGQAERIMRDGLKAHNFDELVHDTFDRLGVRQEDITPEERKAIESERSYYERSKEGGLISTSVSPEVASRWAGSGGETAKNIERALLGASPRTRAEWRSPESSLSDEPVILQMKLKPSGMQREDFQRYLTTANRVEELAAGARAADQPAELFGDFINHASDIRIKPGDVESIAVVQEPYEDQGARHRYRPSYTARRLLGLEKAGLGTWDESKHPRGQPNNAGQFAAGGGGGEAGPSEDELRGRAIGHGYSPHAKLIDGVIVTPSIYDATRALYEGRKVELQQPRQLATLIDHLGQVSKVMIDKGRDAPNFNLCNVSVKGTNLFCAQTMGIERIKMPQLEDPKGFRKWLEKQGVSISKEKEGVAYLRATQNELNGVKVAKMAKLLREGKLEQERLIVSREGYILDGHHHWAAQIGIDAQDNKLGDRKIKIARVDLPILKLMEHAERYTGGKGHKGFHKYIERGQQLENGLQKYDPEQPRDYHGRWTIGGLGAPEQSEKAQQQLKDLTSKTPGLAHAMKYMSPDERARVKSAGAKKIVEVFKSVNTDEMAAVAFSGQGKRGWYRESARAIVDIFGARDAPRFAALLGATSPHTSIESNATNALNIWKNWISYKWKDKDGVEHIGRPTDRASIEKIMGMSVQGEKGKDSVLPAWINNTVTALSTEDPENIILSGPKADSFMRNLRGEVNAVTLDTWMANFSHMDPDSFRRGGGTLPLKSPTYIGYSAAVREASEKLTKLTGSKWTPAEIQETVWSWTRTIYETGGKGKLATDMLKAGGMKREDINNTPDFATLFTQGVYRNILEKAGYGKEVGQEAERAGARGAGMHGGRGGGISALSAEGSGIAQDTFERHLLRAAGRLDQLREERELERERNRKPRVKKFNENHDPETGRFASGGGPSSVMVPLGGIRNASAEVLVNPTLSAMKDMARDISRDWTPEERARTAISLRAIHEPNGNLYVWNAYDTVHEVVAETLHLPRASEYGEWAVQGGRLWPVTPTTKHSWLDDAAKAPRKMAKMLIKFNENHDPETGRFASGGGENSKIETIDVGGRPLKVYINPTARMVENSGVKQYRYFADNNHNWFYWDANVAIHNFVARKMGVEEVNMRQGGDVTHKQLLTELDGLRKYSPDQPRDEQGRFSGGTMTVYKQMRYKDGQLYSLFHGTKKPMPIGKWMRAKDLRSDIGQQAKRPGLYAAPYPTGKQFWTRTTPPHIQGQRVWVEAEIPNNELAHAPGRIPRGGYYRFKGTNDEPWYVAGAMRINRILSDREVRGILHGAGKSKEATIEQHPRVRFKDYVSKGEGPGHPFRGNQYTDGLSGDAAPPGGPPHPERWPAAVEGRALAAAREAGYDPSKVQIKTDEYKFTLNGNEYSAAGTADTQTGVITLYPQHINDDQEVDGVFAHELMHEKYEAYRKALDEESKAMQRELQLTPVGPNDPMLADGTLRFGWEDKYPLYQAHAKYEAGRQYDMSSAGDVTPYAGEWWKAWKEGTATTDQAVGETLSEMASLDRRGRLMPNIEAESEKFKAAGISLDVRYGVLSQPSIYSMHVWGKDAQDPANQVSRDSLPPHLQQSLSKLEAAAKRHAELYFPVYPTKEWWQLYELVGAHWNKTHPLQKYSPDQPRDFHGRWVEGGAGEIFASPNVGNLDFKGAQQALNSDRQRYISRAFRAVDAELGLAAHSTNVVGAWRDGAENSVISKVENASWDQLMLAAAMKGSLAHQKQVLAFQEAEGGEHFMATFKASGTLDQIHKYLLDQGLEYHTLEPSEGGAVVHVYGQDDKTADLVQTAGKHYGAEVTARAGKGEFVGTQKESGDDAYQRLDARQVYAQIIGSSRVQGASAAWDRVRARFRRPDTVKRLLTKGDEPGHPFRGNQYTEGTGGGEEEEDDLKEYGERIKETPTRGPSMDFLTHQADLIDEYAKVEYNDPKFAETSPLFRYLEYGEKVWTVPSMTQFHGSLAGDLGLGRHWDNDETRTGFIYKNDLPDIKASKGGLLGWVKARHDKVRRNKWHGAYIPEERAHERVVAKYSPDQPRDDHGRWAEGGGDFARENDVEETIRSAALAYSKGLFMEHAKHLDFPADKVTFVQGRKEPRVGFGAVVASVNTETGRIKVFEDVLASASDDEIKGSTAHEIMHIKVASYLRDHPEVEQGLAHRSPLFAKLMKDDGVTGYSKAVWRSWQGGIRPMPNYLPVHETLAEIASEQYLGRKIPKLSKDWRKLYDDINDHWDKRHVKKYSPDQPRDDHGRWAEGGGGGTLAVDSKQELIDLLNDRLTPEQHHTRIKQTLLNVAKEEKYPERLITFATGKEVEPRLKQIEGWGVTGEANTTTGEIVFYLDNMRQLPSSAVAGDMSHEIMHQKFQTYMDAHPKLLYDINRGTRTSVSGKVTSTGIFDELRKTDGVSAYSEEYWQAWEKSNNIDPRDPGSLLTKPMPNHIPVHETLAEMAALKRSSNLTVGAPVWRDLYDKIEANWKEYAAAGYERPHRMKKYSPDQPRDDHGRWTDGGGSDELTRQEVYRNKPDIDIAHATEVIHNVAKEHAVDPALVHISGELKVKEGSFSSLIAGQYHLATGDISLWPNALPKGTDAEIAGLAAHEITHLKYDVATKAADPDIKALIDPHLTGANMRLLQIDDGVSKYSSMYWKAAEQQIANLENLRADQTKRGIPPDKQITYDKILRRSITETLAEMAERKQRTGKLYGSPRWKKLYNDVQTAYGMLQTRKQKAA